MSSLSYNKIVILGSIRLHEENWVEIIESKLNIRSVWLCFSLTVPKQYKFSQQSQDMEWA
jgi:hypothetical protein